MRCVGRVSAISLQEEVIRRINLLDPNLNPGQGRFAYSIPEGPRIHPCQTSGILGEACALHQRNGEVVNLSKCVVDFNGSVSKENRKENRTKALVAACKLLQIRENWESCRFRLLYFSPTFMHLHMQQRSSKMRHRS